MTIMPPSPFIDSAVIHLSADAAAVSATHAPAGAAANQSSMSTGGTKEPPLAGPPNNRPVSGDFDGPDIPLYELMKRGFDVEAFMIKVEPLPLFLQRPIRADELMPVLAVMAKY